MFHMMNSIIDRLLHIFSRSYIEGNMIADLSGHRERIDDPTEWNKKRRDDCISEYDMSRYVPAWIPRLTKEGFKKMKIPQKIMQV